MDINELKEALDNGVPVEYSAHCQKRMLERGISRSDIKHCIYDGEIIEVNVLADKKTIGTYDKNLNSLRINLVYSAMLLSLTVSHLLTTRTKGLPASRA